MRKFLLIIPLLAVAACSTTPSPSPREEGLEVKADSSVLTIAVLSTTAFDSLEKDVALGNGKPLRIIRLDSQWDCDTALLNKHADVVSMDEDRWNYYRRTGKAQNWEIIRTMEQKWGLYACGSLRLKEVKNLKGKTVATSRECADNRKMTEMLTVAGLKHNEVFFPQINDFKLRLQMLDNGQVDAAMLPEPYATMADSAHHTCLKKEKTKYYLIRR